LKISPETVRHYIYQIYQRLHVRSAVQLLRVTLGLPAKHELSQREKIGRLPRG
jgi:DNA-binding NarL/FixJ family response regulator